MDILYDSVAGRAKVTVREGLNAGKTFLRLYGSKKEYMVRQGDYPACRRSYLGERLLYFVTYTSNVLQQYSSMIAYTCRGLHSRKSVLDWLRMGFGVSSTTSKCMLRDPPELQLPERLRHSIYCCRYCIYIDMRGVHRRYATIHISYTSYINLFWLLGGDKNSISGQRANNTFCLGDTWTD